MRCFVYLLGCTPQKEGTYQKKAFTVTITITISIILRTWVLTSTCSPTIRCALIILRLNALTSSSTSRAIHVRESLTKTLPMIRHWGTITLGGPTYLLLPFPNPKGLDSLLGIFGLGISWTNRGASLLELTIPKQPNPYWD